MRDDAARAALIRAETVVASPLLCPELRLHLITDACRLWTATDPELEALALPAPYWAFAWAGGQALARHVLDHPALVQGKVVLDFGAGGAVEGLAAARAGAAEVWAADIDPYADTAARLNAALNGLHLETTTEDLIGQVDPAWSVVLAGDVTYDAPMAARVRSWLVALAARGVLVLLADPGRGFLDTAGFEVLGEHEAPADVDADGTHRVTTRVYRVR
jgi:predicted nicotinamide N-methyase